MSTPRRFAPRSSGTPMIAAARVIALLLRLQLPQDIGDLLDEPRLPLPREALLERADDVLLLDFARLVVGRAPDPHVRILEEVEQSLDPRGVALVLEVVAQALHRPYADLRRIRPVRRG